MVFKSAELQRYLLESRTDGIVENGDEISVQVPVLLHLVLEEFLAQFRGQGQPIVDTQDEAGEFAELAPRLVVFNAGLQTEILQRVGTIL